MERRRGRTASRSPAGPGWPTRTLAFASAALSLAVLGLWFGLTALEGDAENRPGSMAFVGVALASLPALTLAGVLDPSAERRVTWLTAAASGLLAWGVISIFSVGLLLLLASVLTWGGVFLAARRSNSPRRPAMIAGAVMVALAAGYLVTL